MGKALEIAMLKEYLTPGRDSIVDQVKDPAPITNEIKPISDNEEDEFPSDRELDGEPTVSIILKTRQ